MPSATSLSWLDLKSSMVDVTVVIPTIPQRRSFLKDATDSVDYQTVQPSEVMIVEDTDGIGAPAIRNKAAKRAKTEWLLFLDDDDWLYPRFIEKTYEHVNEADVVLAWPALEGAPQRPSLWKTYDPSVLDSFCPWGQCALVRRDSFLAVGGQRGGIRYEDWDLWRRMRDNGAKFFTVEERLWVHRIHPGQRTIQDGLNGLPDIL